MPSRVMTSADLEAAGWSDLFENGLAAAVGQPIAKPAGFTLARTVFPFDFWRDATGRVRTNFDRKTWAPTPDTTPWATITTYYVDINKANDSADGLSWANAKKSINAAITAGNTAATPYIIYVRAGTYPRAQSPQGSAGTVVPSQPCALIAVGGRVVTGMFDTLSWTLDTGTTYKATRSNTKRVIDLTVTNQWGLGSDYTWAVDLATCRATPGTWFTDNTTVYVNRLDGAAVTDSNARAMISVSSSAGGIKMSTGGHMYVAGFDCQGGLPAYIAGGAAYRFVAEDCTFRYSSGDDGIVVIGTSSPKNGISVLNVEGAAFIRCDASGNQSDGFNAHLSSGVNPFMFTMDCTGYNNGRAGAFSCNAFTTHDGNKAIDLRGIAADNAGGQIAIVHAGTQMWCIDTMATASRGDQVLGGPVPPSDFLVDQSTPELFLENCVAGSSQYSLNANYGKIWKRGGHFPMATFTSDGGSVVDY